MRFCTFNHRILKNKMKKVWNLTEFRTSVFPKVWPKIIKKTFSVQIFLEQIDFLIFAKRFQILKISVPTFKITFFVIPFLFASIRNVAKFRKLLGITQLQIFQTRLRRSNGPTEAAIIFVKFINGMGYIRFEYNFTLHKQNVTADLHSRLLIFFLKYSRISH